MKLIFPALFITFIIISLVACQKNVNGDISGGGSIKNKIKTYTEHIVGPYFGDSTYTFALSYDGNDRLTAFTSTDHPGFQSVYKYPSDKSFTLDLFIPGQATIHTVYFVNNAKLVDSAVQWDDDAHDTIVQIYTYNASNQCTSLKEYDYTSGGSQLFTSTLYSFDANGNLSQENWDGAITTLYYDSVVLNTAVINNLYFPYPKQLPTREDYHDDVEQYSTVHHYTFDAMKRILSDQAATSKGDTVTKSYTYF